MDQLAVISIILFLFSLAGLAISIYLVFFSRLLMGKMLGAVFFSSSGAAFIDGLELYASTVDGLFALGIIRYVFLLGFVFSLMLFVFDYTGVPIAFRSWKFFALAATPVIIVFLLAVNPNTPAIYAQTDSSINILAWGDRFIRIMYMLLQLYANGLVLFLIYLLLRNLRRKTRLDRVNSISIASGLFLYVSTLIAHLAGLRLPGGYKLYIFTFFPTALLALWGVRRYRLADLRPIAFSTIFSQMQDGILVLDRTGCLVDFNPAAAKFLGGSTRLSPGEAFDLQLLDPGCLEEPGIPGAETSRKCELNGVPVQIVVSGIADSRGEGYGRLVSIRDISSQVEAEQLREAAMIREGVWDERRKVARALHDSLNQYMNGLMMLSAAAHQRLAEGRQDQLPGILDNIQAGARDASEQLRELIHELQIESAEARDFDLLKAAEDRFDFLQRQGLPITWEHPEQLTLPSSSQRELFYILLEAVNNVFRHANARSVLIRISEKNGVFAASVADDGCGFDPGQSRAGGMGLANMRERARLLGADLQIHSSSAGTTVGVQIPLPERNGST